MEKNQKSVVESLVTGLISGFIATQALDLVGTFIYENEDRKTYDDENKTRNGRHAYEVATQQVAGLVGKKLTEQETREYGWKFHRTFGILGGIQYAMMRNKFPKIGKAGGLLYGLGFFFLMDEVMVAVTKQTPGPSKFSWKVHGRGLLAHVAYGVASELTIRLIESAKSASDKASAYAKSSSINEGHFGDDKQLAPSQTFQKLKEKYFTT